VEIPRSFYEGRPEPQTLEEMAAPIRYRREDGRVIGRHIGAQYYTIGQRKGLGIGGHAESCFLIANDIDRNLIFVGEGDSHPGLWRRALHIRPEEVHWIRPDLKLEMGQTLRCQVRIRYRQPLQEAVLHQRDDGMYILFETPQRGITPGQFAVWYADDGEMLGSGVIDQ
jgi:tRNA-specific 2-thiouridylase